MPGWTRISEYKHSPNQPASASKLPGTIIYREYRYLQNTLIIQKFVMFVSFAINMLSLALMTVIHTIQYQIQETKNFMPSIRYKVPYRALGNDVKYKAVGVKVLEKFIFTTSDFLKLSRNHCTGKEPNTWRKKQPRLLRKIISIEQALAEKEPGVTFVGRLASYKYFNMDQVLKSIFPVSNFGRKRSLKREAIIWCVFCRQSWMPWSYLTVWWARGSSRAKKRNGDQGNSLKRLFY